ncbi:GNAT family N-acetyltransferase [Uliginosibacterium sp. H1]|uniref:GNAT family N-acetyltransferase n=1 Tax=Uliginosibacterium sp. H1 TaxID=3114757 RepID=UPI002E18D921|nr:GNAT family N-acetyltransferase [Uliginosibacterium sp. H1]
MPRLLPDLLTTRRLILRAPRMDDAATLFQRYTQDAAVARYMVWRPHTALSQAEGFLAGCLQDWDTGKRQAYVLALAETPQEAIGMVDARPAGGTVDLGYVLARSHWGAGLMPEAVEAVAAAALVRPGGFRVQATCDVDNRASARTLEKAGFSREGRLERLTVHPDLGSEPRACFMYARCR